MSQTHACPCQTVEPKPRSFEECCGPYLARKAKAPTAEALLRSRYTAFVKHDVDYVLETHHPKTKSQVKREEIESWAKESVWIGMKIIKQEGGQASDNKGVIHFHAQYEAHAEDGPKTDRLLHDHFEKSFFERDPNAANAWRFVDAEPMEKGTIRRSEPKTGRNDPCTCGSGKKYKKCHGAAA